MTGWLAVQARAAQMRRQNPDWRYGQALFNALHELDPALANSIRGTIADPFYRDHGPRVGAFAAAVMGATPAGQPMTTTIDLSCEWKPGDVAVFPNGARAMYVGEGEGEPRPWRIAAAGHPAWGDFGPPRPLVVFDPEDREQVGRLSEAIRKQGRCNKSSGLCFCSDAECVEGRVQAALRSLITPPKPEEPTGLGAVVEDAQGAVWVRLARGTCGWVPADAMVRTFSGRAYDNITAIKTLSKGVQS